LVAVLPAGAALAVEVFFAVGAVFPVVAVFFAAGDLVAVDFVAVLAVADVFGTVSFGSFFDPLT